ncbi:MAG: hypothetical protein N2Z23_07415 [Pyrinomonadaceae bacterium]|nr:hypothetical protein [Pyrinomonadaceae bacterium]MCX7640252.1 hypothetical protein [Pyrinomonadaceae bacterium]MDW8305124.1 hypothetical protein [Acidobacteriota bacterium]
MDYSEYFFRIEKVFQKHRKNAISLTPLDWDIVESWFNRGIPLHLILRVLDDSFSKLDENRKRKLNSLRYFRKEVERVFKEWLFSQIGRQQEDSRFEDFVLLHLQQKIEALSHSIERLPDVALKESLAEVLSRLITLKMEIENQTKNHLKGDQIEKEQMENLEFHLKELDEVLTRVILVNSDEELIEKCRRWAEKEAYKYKRKVSREVYQKTLETLFLKALRDEYRLPKLGLFEL